MIDTENDQCLTSDICVFVYLFVVCDGQGWSLIGDYLLSDNFGFLLFVFVCCFFFFFFFVFVYLFVVCDGQGWSLIGDCLLSERFGFLLFVFVCSFVCCFFLFSYCFCLCVVCV